MSRVPPRQVEASAAPSAGDFEWPLRVYWEDTDAGGIVFYANYLKFMERGRTEWLRALGVHQHDLREHSGGMFVVSEAQLKYHRPARLDDELCVVTRLQQLGTASIVVAQQVFLLSPDASPAGADSSAAPSDPSLSSAPPAGFTRILLCEGSIRIGWVDAQRMRPARIPAQIVGTLQAAPGSMGVATGRTPSSSMR